MNFWLAPNKKAGPRQGFTLDIGCLKKVSGIQLKNTRNRMYKNRGTKRFRLLASKSVSGPWKAILQKTLEDSRKKKPCLLTIQLVHPQIFRFVKFELLEYWGKGGGLQHFSLLTDDNFDDIFGFDQLSFSVLTNIIKPIIIFSYDQYHQEKCQMKLPGTGTGGGRTVAERIMLEKEK